MPRQVKEHSPDELKVLTLKECAALISLSWMTLKRMIQRGDGPTVIQLSPRRVGVRMIDARRWQEARLRSAS